VLPSYNFMSIVYIHRQFTHLYNVSLCDTPMLELKKFSPHRFSAHSFWATKNSISIINVLLRPYCILNVQNDPKSCLVIGTQNSRDVHYDLKSWVLFHNTFTDDRLFNCTPDYILQSATWILNLFQITLPNTELFNINILLKNTLSVSFE